MNFIDPDDEPVAKASGFVDPDEAPVTTKAAPNEAAEFLKRTGKNALGGLDAAVSMAAGMPAYIASGFSGLAHLPQGLDKAAAAVEHTQKQNFGFGAPKPFTPEGEQVNEMLGEELGAVRSKAGDLGAAVGGDLGRTHGEIAADVIANFLPIPGGKFVHALGKGVEREFMGKGEKPPVMPERAAPAKFVDPDQMELPLENTTQQGAEVRGAAVGQPDLFGPTNVPQAPMSTTPWGPAPVPRKLREAQAAIDQRQLALEQDVKRQQGLDFNAAERARQEAAPVPGTEDALARETQADTARTQPYMDERNQGLIDDTPHNGNAELPYTGNVNGVVPRDAFTRLDENGMPVRADRAMEAQNLQDPLQRNMWGDEMPRQSEQEAARGITAAMDRMDPTSRFAAAMDNLVHSDSGYVPMAERFPKGQRGAIDVMEIAKGFAAYKRGAIDGRGLLEAFGGAFHPEEMDFAKRNVRNGMSRETVVFMTPEQFHLLAEQRPESYMNSVGADVRRDSVRHALTKREHGLNDIPTLLIDGAEGGVAQVTGHEGRHRSDVFKEMGVPVIPVKIKSHTQRWGDPDRPTALRPEWSKDDSFVTPLPEPLTPVRKAIPESMRGALDFGPRDIPNNPKVSKLTPDSPEVKAAREELLRNRKVAAVNKILGNEYVDNVTSPEQVLAAAAEGAKDITPAQALRAKTVGSGVNALSLNTNNPLAKFMRYVYREAEKVPEMMVREHITGNTGIDNLWRKLNRSEKNAAWDVLQNQSVKETYYTPDELRDLGMNSKQIEFIHKQADMQAVMLDFANGKLGEVGKKPIEGLDGHLPGVFTGDYKTTVHDAKGNVIGVIGTGTRQMHTVAVAKMKALYPDAKFVEVPRRQLGGMGNHVYQQGLSELAEVLAKHDPDFAALQKDIKEITADRANELYGAHYHQLHKKHVWGNEGNKPWLESASKNTDEGYKSYINYWDENLRSYSNLPVETQVKGLINNPHLDMPNAKDYASKYILNATGKSTAKIGQALDTIIDTPFKATGFGPSFARNIISGSAQRIGQTLMGFANLAHTAIQFTQVPVMAWPALARVVSQFKLNPVDWATSQAVGTKMMFDFNQHRAPKDAWETAIRDHAEKQGYGHFSEFQEIKDTEKSKVARTADQWIDWNRSFAEKWTRPMVFFSMMDMLKHEPHLSMEQKLSVATNATQEAMIDYAHREKPMMYGDLGQAGKLSGSLSTFKHGAYSQAGRLIKGVGKGEIMPLLVAVGTMQALAGIKGLWGYDDADRLVKQATKEMGQTMSISELLLEPNIAKEWVKNGILSAGMDLDLSGRIAINSALPDSFSGAFIGPFGEKVVKLAKTLGSDEPGSMYWKNLAVELAPNGPAKGMLREVLKNDPETNRLTGTDGHPGNPRSQMDVYKNRAGVNSLAQRKLNDEQYMDSQRDKQKDDTQKSAVKEAAALWGQGELSEKKNAELLAKFIANDGLKEQWVARIKGEGVNKVLDKQQRIQGYPKNQQDMKGIHNFLNYQRSRDAYDELKARPN